MFHLTTLPNEGSAYILVDGDDSPLTFSTGQAAAAAALEHSRLLGRKVQPRRIATSDSWHVRELSRFDSGAYGLVPWYDASWWVGAMAKGADGAESGIRLHFAHLSKDDPTKIAYTPDSSYGDADRQVRVLPGRYLTKFFGIASPDCVAPESCRLSAEDVARIVAKSFREETELRFASTADEIENVYTSGPESCMSHDHCEYDSPFHPVRVYGYGDVKIAYLERLGRITARCVTFKKQYGRIYGDQTRLASLLESAGFNYDSSCLNGARLTLHRVNDGYVMPYLDNASGARESDDGKSILLGRGYEIETDSTCGLVNCGSWALRSCDECGERIDEDESHWSEYHGATYCESCYQDRHTNCGRLHETFANAEMDFVEMANGETWSQTAVERYGAVVCEDDDLGHVEDDYVRDSDGTPYSMTYAARNLRRDEESGEYHPLADMTETAPDVWRLTSKYESDLAEDVATAESVLESLLEATGHPSAALAVEPRSTRLLRLGGAIAAS